MPLQIVRNDITKVTADAIVNTANPEPVIGAGTDSAIYKAAGEEKLLAARKKIGDIAPGEAYATPAFELNANLIVHTVGPIWEGGEHGECEILRSCYLNSLELASQYKCRSIAFPLIATGIYGFPREQALEIANETINGFLADHEMDVYLVVFDETSVQVGSSFARIQEFVDAEYVKVAGEVEYCGGERVYKAWNERRRRELEHLERSYMEKKISKEEYLSGRFTLQIGDDEIRRMKDRKDKSFSERYLEIMGMKGDDPPKIYAGYLDRRLHSKIQGDKDYHPSKQTAILVCLMFHLDLAETLDLMSYASLTLSPGYKPDVIVMDCILHKKYRLMDINAELEENGFPSLDHLY